MAVEPSTRDKLITEILGDVGKIYAEVEASKNSLPALVSETENKINAATAALIAASERIRAESETRLGAGIGSATAMLERKAHSLAEWYAKELDAAAKAAAMKQAATLLDPPQRSIEEALRGIDKIVQEAREKVRRTALLVVLCSLVAGALGAMGATLGLGVFAAKPTAESTALIEAGKTLGAAWPRLDAATRKRISEAAQKN